MYVSSRPRGLGQPNPAPTGTVIVGPPLPVRPTRLACSPAHLATVRSILGRPTATVESLRAELQELARRAADWASDAAITLDRRTRIPTTVARFRAIFGVAPSFVPSWRPAGQHWDRGDVVARRLTVAARLLSGGDLRFVCRGPSTGACGPTFFACQTPGSRQVVLGTGFWQAVAAGDAATAGGTLLAAAFSAAFAGLLGPNRTQPLAAIPCYLRFTLETVGLPVSATLLARCTGTGVPATPTIPPAPAPGTPPAPPGQPGPRIPTPREAAEDWVRRHPRTIDDEIRDLILDATTAVQQSGGTIGDRVWERAGRPIDRILEKLGASKTTRDRIGRAARRAVEAGAKEGFSEALAAEGVRGEAADALSAIVSALLNSRIR